MITILSKLLIDRPDDFKDPSVRKAYGMLSGAVGIFLNLCLFAGKFAAGMISGSISITADAFNNLSDAGSSIITLIGFKMAGQKPDPDHPFGHGRIEYVAGLFVSVMILVMGLELLQTSVSKVLTPQTPDFSPIILVILLSSILVKYYMFFYNKSLGKKMESAAMLATATDSFSDILATAMVLAATLIGHFTNLAIDGWCGILVGLFICRSGYCAAKGTINPLLGQAPDKEFVHRVEQIVVSHEKILGVHDLIVHNYGPDRTLISLHAEVPADGDLLTLHDLIDGIEHELHNTLNCHAVIHMDPVRLGDQETARMQALVQNCLAQIDPSITMHDFHLVKEPSCTKLAFDVVVPYQFGMTDEELTKAIGERIQSHAPGYETVIEVDKAQL